MLERKNIPYTVVRRRRFVQYYLNLHATKILEAGALDCPTFYPDEVDIEYLDWFATEELKQFAINGSGRNINLVCDVKYPVKDKHFAKHIPGKFDLFIANHVIEHVPDVISWLQNIEKVLAPGGFAFLSIPDKRYTFDYIRRESTVTDFLRCYTLDLEKPDVWQIFDAMYYHRSIRRKDVDSGAFRELVKKRNEPASEIFRKAKIKAKNYVSLHCSVFSYPSFERLFNDLLETNLINFKLVATGDVPPNKQEFHVLLQKR